MRPRRLCPLLYYAQGGEDGTATYSLYARGGLGAERGTLLVCSVLYYVQAGERQ